MSNKTFPQYLCNKVVGALLITKTSRKLSEDFITVNVEEEGYGPFKVMVDTIPKDIRPIKGWYFIEYNDGYRSFSPSKAFKDGYSLKGEESIAHESDKGVEPKQIVGRTLSASTAKNMGASVQISDLKVEGISDPFKLISKASSDAQGWFKSTKAMEIPDLGVLVQVSTLDGGIPAEALAFVPSARLVTVDSKTKIIKGY